MATPRCGGLKHKTKEPCQQPAGWGTDHVGQGRCKLHGGCNPIKHGMYSTCLRGRAREVYDLLKDAPVDDASDEIRVGMAQFGAAIEQLADLSTDDQRELLDAVSRQLARLILAKQRQAKLSLAQRIEITGGDGGPVSLQWIGGLTERFDGDDDE
jgi:hypothetical protein